MAKYIAEFQSRGSRLGSTVGNVLLSVIRKTGSHARQALSTSTQDFKAQEDGYAG